ncbi:hypothetical protein PMKS-002770 [Pichia membranifaciens]|uniref:Uncharacterized protein n=1 Tax=Pichia membranifaciens TaxID=4926 RepID=A0A1Q2YIB4_9ASCO|nr:hypothetical protein PMKS-002770 [Pichia membranifaciens]
MALLDDGQTIASCSNDLSIKCWNYNTGTKSTLGYHDDYIKKIGYTKGHRNELVSAGLDKVVKVWDTIKGQPISSYKFKDFNNSIYSLDVNNDMIICSGPSNIINLFDRRDMTKPVKTFLGHTDNVRALLLKDNSFLSGSSDTTLKLWDLRSTRILRNFEMHSSPVWSIYTPDYSDDFSIFYSADKSGLLLKTDLRAADLNSQNMSGYFNYKVNESLGISTVIANVNYSNTSSDNSSVADLESSLSGINDIVETDDLGTIWTATASTIHNANTNYISSWSIPQTGKLVIHQGLVLNRRLASLYNNNNNTSGNGEAVTPASNIGQHSSFQLKWSANAQNDLQIDTVKSNDSINDTEDLVSQLSGDDLDQIDNAFFSNTNGLDKLLVENSPQTDSKTSQSVMSYDIDGEYDTVGDRAEIGEVFGEREGDDETEEDGYEYATCFIELWGNLNTHFLFADDYISTLEQEVESIDPFHDAIGEYDPFNSPQKDSENNLQVTKKMVINCDNVNEDEILLLPFNIKPISKISGTSGLIRSKILNNRRDVAAMDQTGCVYIFDILKCKLIHRVDNHLSVNSIDTVESDKAKSDVVRDEPLTATNEDELSLSDRFEAVCEKFQTQETLPTWCSVQVKAGQLFVTLKENNFIACEIYTDDFFEYYSELKDQAEQIKNLRVDLGKIVVKTFFGNVLDSYLQKIIPSFNATSTEKLNLSDSTLDSGPGDSSSSNDTSKSAPQRRPHPSSSTNSGSAEKTGGSKRGLFGRLKQKDPRKELSSSPSSPSVLGAKGVPAHSKSKADLMVEKINQVDDTSKLMKFLELNPEAIPMVKAYQEGMDDRRNEEIPVFDYAPENEEEEKRGVTEMSTLVVINEETQLETRPAYTVYLNELMSRNIDEEEVVRNIPIWIAKGLLLDLYPIPSSMLMKIGFSLVPMEGSNLSKLNDEKSMRLNAVGTLRVARILDFVRSKLPAEEARAPLELVCKDAVLGEKYTLGTIKARVWRQGGDIEIFFRKKAV